MATKPQRKKKAMTLEDLGTAIQRDLARIATKDDLKDLATKEDLRKLREQMETLDGDLAVRLSNVKDELQEQIAGLKYAKEIDDLRARVVRVEGKLGIKHSQRAA
jgi:hypothetical protein